MNIPPILEGHRRELAQRIERLRQTTRRERAERRALLAGLREELESHALAERRAVYCELNKLPRQLRETRVPDPGPVHRFLLMLVGELETTDARDATWRSKLAVLVEWLELRLDDAERRVGSPSGLGVHRGAA